MDDSRNGAGDFREMVEAIPDGRQVGDGQHRSQAGPRHAVEGGKPRTERRPNDAMGRQAGRFAPEVEMGFLHALTTWRSPSDLAEMIRYTLFPDLTRVSIRLQLVIGDPRQLELASSCDDGELFGYQPPARVSMNSLWPSTLTLKRGAPSFWSTADLDVFPAVRHHLVAPESPAINQGGGLVQIPLAFAGRSLGVLTIALEESELRRLYGKDGLQLLGYGVSLWAAAARESGLFNGGGRKLDRLSARQRSIVILISQGLATSEIAKQLHVSQPLVKLEVRRIKDLTGTTSRGEIARLVGQRGHEVPTP